MTDRELMQQALEALENAEDQLAKPYSTEAGYAISALRERLARQEQSMNEGYYCVVCGKYIKSVDGVIVHDGIPHPDMAFDDEEHPQ